MHVIYGENTRFLLWVIAFQFDKSYMNDPAVNRVTTCSYIRE